jgi:alanyl aminopeptidase
MFRIFITTTILACLLGCREENTDLLRLDHSVEPVSQLIALSLDPDQETYFGSLSIELKVNEPTSSFRLHALDLGIMELKIKGNGIDEALVFSQGEKGTLSVQSSDTLAIGTYSLHATFTNTYSHQGTGIYKVEYEGRNYLFSQMEPEYARESFPCWDAPEFKIPWELQLIIPTNLTAVANTPIKSERMLGGLKEVVFEPTQPMPSYLLALAVGEFENVPVPDLSTPGNLIVPKGRSDLTAEAVRISPPLLQALEDYFDMPYPYAKLDQLAVPEFNFGAMENVGLITYRDTALLRDPKAITLGQQQWLASIIAHEMAHMWFGNLVTPKWWDDLWLNESFASWIALKMVNQTFPEYEMQNNDIQSRQRAMDTDALSTTKAIRRPIAASDAMAHLFDSLAYNKGMAVLDMIEDWMGEALFREGMVEYMNDYAWGNADAFDLAASLETVADSDVLAIMKSFVTQPGIPLLDFELLGESEVRITQTRYSHFGVELKDARRWRVPVALKQSDGSIRKVLLTRRAQTFKLDKPSKWIYPNADEKGYYRWSLPPAHMKELSEHVRQLGIRSRLGFISNLASLFSAGSIDAPSYLKILASFSKDESPEVRQAVVGNLAGFTGGMIPAELEEVYGTFLSTILSPMIEEIGTTKVEGEAVLIEKLRPALINALGWHCKDPKILQLASEQAKAYRADPYSADPSLAQPFLRLAAFAGDEALFNAYVAKYETVTDPIEKATYLKGLSGFRDPDLMNRSLDYVLSDAVPPHQFRSIPYSLADTDINRRLVLDWLKANYPAIQKKIPEQSISYLPWLVCGQSPELLNEAKAFLLSDERKTQGMQAEFEEAEAVVELNAALREKELENIRHFLK